MLPAAVCVSTDKQQNAALYFRIRALEQSWGADYGGYVQSFIEIAMYESADATGTNLCIAATKTASAADATEVASRAGDNNLTTAWTATAGSPVWWQAKFATKKTVRSIVLKPNAMWYSKSYAFERSVDGVNWVTIAGTYPTTAYKNVNVVDMFLNLQPK